jgi:hypothetical protein
VAGELQIDLPLVTTFQFKYFLKGPDGHRDLVFRRFVGRQPLEPESRLNEIPDAFLLFFPIGKPDDLIGNSRNEWNEDHPRGHLVSEG